MAIFGEGYALCIPIALLRLSLGMVLNCVAGLPGFGQTPDAAILDRLRAEAPKCWETYVQRAKNLQGGCSNQTTSSQTAQKLQPIRYLRAKSEFIMNQHGESLRTIQEESTDGSKYTTRAEVFTRNPNYAFVLQRKNPAADAASPWLISELSKVN